MGILRIPSTIFMRAVDSESNVPCLVVSAYGPFGDDRSPTQHSSKLRPPTIPSAEMRNNACTQAQPISISDLSSFILLLDISS
jgi:hypothetical protein